jgi:hypothetical protein
MMTPFPMLPMVPMVPMVPMFPMFNDACAALETALTGAFRRTIVSDIADAKDFRAALLRMRDSMRSHSWKTGSQNIALGRMVRTFDQRTRQDGFHVLHDWDGKADTVNEDIIPVDVLQYVADKRGGDAVDSRGLAILLDYYFFHLLALLSLRIWDDGDADANLERLDRLLQQLQGSDGSGQRFVDNAETLILIATSHFELHERGYEKLLSATQTLNDTHRTNIALGHAASIGSHLRFGFEATYGRDTVVMRDDNVADYPWLCFALLTLMRKYVRMQNGDSAVRSREMVVESLLNGLTPDARAFVGEPPGSLSSCATARSEFRDLFHQHRESLLAAFERYRPSEQVYSPLSFFFNFSHNILKGTVVDTLLRSEVWELSFNDLLTSMPAAEPIAQSKEYLAKTLMGYARANPDTIRGRPTPVVVYDPQAGRQAFTVTMRKLID